MPRISSGAYTLSNIADGTSPVSAFLSNESHTFAAMTDGSVNISEFTDFTTTLNVFIGREAASFSTATDDNGLAVGSFRLDTPNFVVTGGNWPLASVFAVRAATPVNNAAVIFVSDDMASLSLLTSNQGSLRINVRVRTDVNNVSAFFLEVGFTKQIDGSNSNVIHLSPNKQYFLADADGNIDSNESDIFVDIYTQGNPGRQNYFMSINGGGFNPVTIASTAVGGITSFNFDHSSDIFDADESNSQVTITLGNITGLVLDDQVTITLAGTNFNYIVPTDTPSLETITRGLSALINLDGTYTIYDADYANGTFSIRSYGEGFTTTSSDSTTNAAFTLGFVNNTAQTATLPGNALRLLISPDNLGRDSSDINTLSLHVTGASIGQGSATISFTKVRQGAAGAASLSVVIESSAGDTFLEGATFSEKTLTAVVRDNSNGSIAAVGNFTYEWRENNSSGVGVVVTPVVVGGVTTWHVSTDATDLNRINAETATVNGVLEDLNSIVVGSNDVVGDSTTYSCLVTER